MSTSLPCSTIAAWSASLFRRYASRIRRFRVLRLFARLWLRLGTEKSTSTVGVVLSLFSTIYRNGYTKPDAPSAKRRRTAVSDDRRSDLGSAWGLSMVVVPCCYAFLGVRVRVFFCNFDCCWRMNSSFSALSLISASSTSRPSSTLWQ